MTDLEGINLNGQLSDPDFKSQVVRPNIAEQNSKKFGAPGAFGKECYEDTSESLLKVLKMVKFMGKYRSLIDQYSRTYEDILNKVPAYNEVLFYRIQKVAIDDEGNPKDNGIIQNIWLPKSSNLETASDTMKYIDTQVIYEENYEYTIYAYNLVVGSKYGFQFENIYSEYGTEAAEIKKATYGLRFSQSAVDEGYTITSDPLYLNQGVPTSIPAGYDYGPYISQVNEIYDDILSTQKSLTIYELALSYPLAGIIKKQPLDIKNGIDELQQKIESLLAEIAQLSQQIPESEGDKYLTILDLFNQIRLKTISLTNNEVALNNPGFGIVKKQPADIQINIETKKDEIAQLYVDIENFQGQLSEVTYTDQSFNYFYENAEQKRMAMFDVVCESDVRLVEVPFYKKTTLVSDAASMAPEVDILPLNRNKNEVKINFYPHSVDREVEPIYIEESSDAKKFNKIRFAQDRSLLKAFSTPVQSELTLKKILNTLPPDFYVEPKLLFKSDDYPIAYEVFRLEQPPESYTSFQSATKTSIDATSIHSYTDKLEQNKKYFYMFRSIDVHDNPSNPSPVYQVEMVENSGVVYPLVSIYQFPSPSLGLKAKSFRKHLKIDAQSLQGLVNLEKSLLEDSDTAYHPLNQKVILGTKEKGIFTTDGTKKFKFRIRSKHTGKILDLNIAFRTRQPVPTEDIVGCGDAGQTPPAPSEVDVSFSGFEASKDKGFDGM